MSDSIITFPSGLVYEAVLEETGIPCLLCDVPAVRFVMPAYLGDEGFSIDHFCPAHLDNLVGKIRDIVYAK